MKTLSGLSVVAGLLILSGCAGRQHDITPLGQTTFARYQQETARWVAQHRAFQSADKNLELAWNTPQEMRPPGKPDKGILLVHGLGDSPGSFNDIMPRLAQQGFLVRTVLLPGHGTRPADLLHITVDDWRRVVAEQTAILRHDVDEVYLGGFSTGGNLVLEYALNHPEINGLLLFSPAIKSDERYDFLTPLLSVFRDWILTPRPGYPQQLITRYMVVPTNGFAQFYHSSAAVRRLLAQTAYDKPVLMVLTEHDSVLDTPYLLELFERKFTNPHSRLIWYGDRPAGARSPRVLTRSDYLPEWRISQFSHMSILFSPDNKQYGESGSIIVCANGQTPASRQICQDRNQLWYSDWGYQEEGKTHVRLTFNPYFDWQTQVMNQVLESE
ncbi:MULTISPECIES: alpha/beta hydrolase [Brenneria]|uniref:Alpha/beta fold hydrolase n=1 Tax=Brenneria nigrifluens DSM 30175 = ATCC 13028 TaxID=1121120 RepID=A0A2U1UW13_9GAMM|nr:MULTISPECIES: alpha/beta fold hydrolase [Brenneria]PWC25865.1 alpha/beta hydrolase [Brenneria nigrifluens] [Brenneria nigrifluens DSM 30175 = ATCC 13028]QCR05751.1 alpha/beta fold hydrolase [Brenneria nigrifluens DSM 30175 = ATCC 13028]